MKSISELQKLVTQGFSDWEQYGFVNTKEKGDLILFNYSLFATLEANWTWLERVSRGLILNKVTGEVVARPYDKFYNWSENHIPKPNRRTRKIVSITEKMDGSLGVFYRDPGSGGYKISTRGSFESDQAYKATELLNSKYGPDFSELPYECTLLFEIIYPENRIVVNYGDRETLCLIGARNRFTGEHYDLAFREDVAEYYGFCLPKSFDEIIPHADHSIDYIMSHIVDWDSNQEGVVVEFNNSSLWKFKSPEYCRVHKILSTINFKNVLENVKAGTIDDVMQIVPEHFQEEVNSMVEEIRVKVMDVHDEVEARFREAPNTTDRKTYAQWVMGKYPDYQHYLFARLDGRDLAPLIFKHEFRNRDNKHLIGDV